MALDLGKDAAFNEAIQKRSYPKAIELIRAELKDRAKNERLRLQLASVLALAGNKKEGDFFGEISLLTGEPRSATVTAAARCELLELDKDTVDRISTSHPRVREVLQHFYERRKDSTIEFAVRSMNGAKGLG